MQIGRKEGSMYAWKESESEVRKDCKEERTKKDGRKKACM